MKQNSWRLIDTGPLAGVENMAIDEALLSSFVAQSSEPVLRLYGWRPAALSLGRFQAAGEVLDLERCRHESVPFVRRVSGGGVIYHAEELTYSIVCSPEHISTSASVKDSFRTLTSFLLAFYHRLGLNPSYAVDAVPDCRVLGSRTAFCFAGKESFDILIDGRKIGGNAQRRKKGIIFQHGSIPLLNCAAKGLGYMRDSNPAYALGVVSLSDCGITSERTELISLLTESFRYSLGAELKPTHLSEAEQDACQYHLENKYLTDRWNLFGEAI